MFKPLPCCLALLAIAIGEPADVQPASDTQSMEQHHFRPQTLLTALETWVSSQFDLPAIHEHPIIEFASPAKIVSLRFPGLLSDPGAQVAPNDRVSSAQHDTIAIYYDATRTIYLPEGWTGDTPAELSVLVHEVVHPLSKCAEAQIRVPTGAREACLYRSGPLARSIWIQSRERLSYGCVFVIGENTMFLVDKRVRWLHRGSISCCVRAVSGHAAAPPSSVMNSRLFTRSPRRRAPAARATIRGRAPWRLCG